MDTPADEEPCECKQSAMVEMAMESIAVESFEPPDIGPGFDEEEMNSIFELGLLRIPQEVLLHVFSFIDADYLLNTVAYVCQDLKNLLFNEKYWKIRLFKRFPKPYPIVTEPDMSWRSACKERETCKRIWKSDEMREKMITLNKVCGTGIDAIHLMQNRSVCISGNKDRSMTVWKLNPEPGSNNDVNPTELFCKHLMQHNGWVWSVTSFDDQFCSTSFDTTVKFWDAETLQQQVSIKAHSPVLCSSYLDRNTLVAGCYSKKTILVDNRSSEVVQEFQFHRRSVLKIESNDNHIISTGEDGLLIIADKRNHCVLNKSRIKSTFAMALDSHTNQIWTGTRNQNIFVYNTCNINSVSLAAQLDYGFTGKVTGLQYTTGAVYSGSTDGWLKIFEPTFDPDPIAEFEFLGFGGVCDLSLVDKRLAVCTGYGLVALWDPYCTN